MATLSEQEVQNLVKRSAVSPEVQAAMAEESTPSKTNDKDVQLPTRDVLIIGCGDGGSNIAAAMSLRDPVNTYTILYNTNRNTLEKLKGDARLHPVGTEGMGKSREDSKNAFRAAHEEILGDIQNALKTRDFKYILVTTTADGGTGSGMSVVLSRILMDNYNIPLIILGVYPSIDEDPQAQVNALNWQMEVLSQNIPYVIMDNSMVNAPTIREVHETVNAQAAEIAALLTGVEYGVTNVRQIDCANIQRLTHTVGGRIIACQSSARPTTGQTLGDYIDNMLQKCCQPLTTECGGIGLWVKGPKDMLESMGDKIPVEIRTKYGNGTIRFEHIEESELVSIGIILTDANEVTNRINDMRHIYDDLMNAQNNRPQSVLETIGKVENPMSKYAANTVRAPKQQSADGKLNVSAFDDL